MGSGVAQALLNDNTKCAYKCRLKEKQQLKLIFYQIDMYQSSEF